MPEKQKVFINILSNSLIIIVAIVLMGCTWLFVRGQIDANRAITDAGKAVIAAVDSSTSGQKAVDYAAAITYLEAAQQAYSENSMIKIASLIYALSSSVILGYGAKVLRLGASDKQELCNELLEKTAQQFSKSSDQMLRQQNDVYAAVTSCENAAHLSLLLLSYFELISSKKYEKPITAATDATNRLQVEFIRSLSRFQGFLNYFKESSNKMRLTQDQLEMLKRTWEQAERSIDEYACVEKDVDDYLIKNFGEEDKDVVSKIVKSIKAFWRQQSYDNV